jgi:calcineurin-like phosphoesterase family protein
MSFRKIDDFNNIYITSDLHLSYTLNRSIQLRGFDNPIEHTRTIRDNINSVCKSHSDILIINGDFSSDMDLARVFLKEITPKNIWLTIGNHDKRKEIQSLFKDGCISRLEHEIKIRWRDELYHIQHLPLLEFDQMYRNSYHWFGHCHGRQKPYLRAMDCSPESWDLKPIPLDKIVEMRSMYNNIDENGKRAKIEIENLDI